MLFILSDDPNIPQSWDWSVIDNAAYAMGMIPDEIRHHTDTDFSIVTAYTNGENDLPTKVKRIWKQDDLTYWIATDDKHIARVYEGRIIYLFNV